MPLVQLVRTAGTGAPNDRSRGPETSSPADNSIDKSCEAARELYRLITDTGPAEYADRIEHVISVLEKRPQAPENEIYKVVKHENLTKFYNYVLKKGFFHQGYEEKDLTKHTDDSLGWIKSTMLHEKLISALDGRDIFSYLHNQMISDVIALGADNNIVRSLSYSINKAIIGTESTLKMWVRYLGEDNPLVDDNIRYLTGDEETRKRIGGGHMAQSTRYLQGKHVLNSSNFSKIIKGVTNDLKSLGDMISEIFTLLHSFTYAKIIRSDDTTRLDIMKKYDGLYSNLRILEFSIWPMARLDLIVCREMSTTKTCGVVDICEKKLTMKNLRDQIDQEIYQESEANIYRKIYDAIHKIVSSCDIENDKKGYKELVESTGINPIDAVVSNNALLLNSIFKVEDVSKDEIIARINRLVGVENPNNNVVSGVEANRDSNNNRKGASDQQPPAAKSDNQRSNEQPPVAKPGNQRSNGQPPAKNPDKQVSNGQPPAKNSDKQVSNKQQPLDESFDCETPRHLSSEIPENNEEAPIYLGIAVSNLLKLLREREKSTWLELVGIAALMVFLLVLVIALAYVVVTKVRRSQ